MPHTFLTVQPGGAKSVPETSFFEKRTISGRLPLFRRAAEFGVRASAADSGTVSGRSADGRLRTCGHQQLEVSHGGESCKPDQEGDARGGGPAAKPKTQSCRPRQSLDQ